MRQVAVLVEGQTEERFSKRVLAPFLAERCDAYLATIVVATSRAASGAKFKGGGGWAGYRRDLRNILRSSHWDLVTTMIDFYAYPDDAPGKDCASPHLPYECAAEREAAIAADFGDARLRPFVMLHEFESLIFAAAVLEGPVLGSEVFSSRLRSELAESGGEPELINDSPMTAPSKRVQRLWPEYSKAIDGVAILEDAGIDSLLESCPHFANWVREMCGRGDYPAGGGG